MKPKTLAAATVAGFLIAGGGIVAAVDGVGTGSSRHVPQAPPAVAVTLPSSDPNAGCHIRVQKYGILPDARCTPGAINPAVTQDNINETICVPGYTARPGIRNVPRSERTRVLHAYGLPATGFYGEVDHLISLELGGSNDQENLWPEPGPEPNPKDGVENKLHHEVCAGQMSLVQAQQIISTDWTNVLENGG